MWRWALVVYWVLLFVGTYIPTAPVIVPAGSDKLAKPVQRIAQCPMTLEDERRVVLALRQGQELFS